MAKNKCAQPEFDLSAAGGELDRIHAKRWAHAASRMALELISLEDPRVDAVMNRWSAAVLPGPRLGLDYPDGERQILESQLQEARYRKEQAELAAKRAGSKRKACPKK